MTATSGFNVGDLVECRSPGGDVIERGFVTRRNDRVVFVRFGLEMHAKACAASDLHLIPVTLTAAAVTDEARNGTSDGHVDGSAAYPLNGLAVATTRFSSWLDGTYLADLDPESLLWRRVTKGSEEAGEVQKALRAFVGENPRKPPGALGDVIAELLDEAFAALGAVEHLTGNHGRSVELLFDHALRVCNRVGLGPRDARRPGPGSVTS